VIIRLPGPRAARTRAGRPDQLAVTISPEIPTCGSCWTWPATTVGPDPVAAVADPDQAHGRVSVRRSGAGRQSSGRGDKIQSLGVAVDLSGTIAHPAWKIRSDLGPKLVAAIDTAIRQELDTRCTQFVASVNQRLQADLGNFDRMVQTRCDAVLAKHNIRNNEIQQLGCLVAARVPGMANLPDAVKNLPAAQQVLKLLPQNAPGGDHGAPPPAIPPLKLF